MSETSYVMWDNRQKSWCADVVNHVVDRNDLSHTNLRRLYSSLEDFYSMFPRIRS